MKKSVSKHVIVVTSLKILSGQHQLAGIIDANLGKTRWNISVIDNKDLTIGRLRKELAAHVDGFIIHLPGTDEAMHHLLETNIPTVLVNIGRYKLPKGRQHLSCFWTDNNEIGRLGAEHFLSKDEYRTFAFLYSESYESTSDGFWSQERRRGFRDRIRQANVRFEAQSFDSPLNEWLRSVAKPAALMTADDSMAVRLKAICQNLGISTPNEISILGVDDVATCDQNISSVNIDFRQAGHMEVRELSELMYKPHRKGSFELMIPCKGVVCRKSTAIHACSDIPTRALRFITENACSGISVSDVITHLGCSRRLAELRFRQHTNRSIRKEIERVRLIHARKLLSARHTTLKAVAEKCGYSSADILSRALARTATSTTCNQRKKVTCRHKRSPNNFS